jgi:hypothetical protein
MFQRKFDRYDSFTAPLINFGIGKMVGLAVGTAAVILLKDKIMNVRDQVEDKYERSQVNKMLELGKERCHEDNYQEKSDFVSINNDTTLTEKIGDVLQ